MASFFISIGLLFSFFGLFFSGVPGFLFWASVVVVFVVFSFNQIGGGGVSLSMAVFFLIFCLVALFAQLLDYIRNSKFDRTFGYDLKRSASDTLNFNALLVWGWSAYVISIFLYIYSAGGVLGVAGTWVDIAASRSTAQVLAVNASVAFYLLSITNMLLVCFCSVKRKFLGFLFLLIFGVFYGFVFRAKSMLLPVLLPLAVLWYFSSDSRFFLKFLKMIFAGCCVVFLYFLVTAFRWVGSLEGLTFASFFDALHASVNAGFERNLVFQASSVFQFYESHEGLMGGAYSKALLLPISFFDVLNLDNPMYVYFSIIGGGDGEMRGSAHPTIFVDAFAAFGWLGVIVGGGWVLLLRILFNYLRKGGAFICAAFLVVSAYAIPLLVRGSVYYGILYFLFGLFCFYILNLIFYRLRVRRID